MLLRGAISNDIVLSLTQFAYLLEDADCSRTRVYAFFIAHFLCVLVFLNVSDNPAEDKYMLIFICFI